MSRSSTVWERPKSSHELSAQDSGIAGPGQKRESQARSGAPGPRIRKANVYDAVAGRISHHGAIPQPSSTTSQIYVSSRDTATRSTLAVPPEDVLFRRRGAPPRFLEADTYWSPRTRDEHLQKLLPDSALLEALHVRASEVFAGLAPGGGLEGLWGSGVLEREKERRAKRFRTKGMKNRKTTEAEVQESQTEDPDTGVSNTNTTTEPESEPETTDSEDIFTTPPTAPAQLAKETEPISKPTPSSRRREPRQPRHHQPPAGFGSLDETALLALGVLVEEACRNVLRGEGDLVFTEPASGEGGLDFGRNGVGRSGGMERAMGLGPGKLGRAGRGAHEESRSVIAVDDVPLATKASRVRMKASKGTATNIRSGDRKGRKRPRLAANMDPPRDDSSSVDEEDDDGEAEASHDVGSKPRHRRQTRRSVPLVSYENMDLDPGWEGSAGGHREWEDDEEDEDEAYRPEDGE